LTTLCTFSPVTAGGNHLVLTQGACSRDQHHEFMKINTSWFPPAVTGISFTKVWNGCLELEGEFYQELYHLHRIFLPTQGSSFNPCAKWCWELYSSTLKSSLISNPSLRSNMRNSSVRNGPSIGYGDTFEGRTRFSIKLNSG
jgi:hypothetical protein